MKLSALLGSSCVASLAFAAAPAVADTTVTGDSATPLVTSSAGDVAVQKDAELEVAAGAAITIDSHNDVTIEDDDSDDSDDEPGQVIAGEDDGATGILVEPGVTTTIANGGTISVLEDFEPEDEDANGIADGSLAFASGRYGIHVAAGGTVTGTIENTGTITVEGLDSGGVVVDSMLDGSMVQDGTIRVVGDNSVGVRTANVTGDVVMEGTTTVTGRGATALDITGDVGGTVRLQGIVGQTTSFSYDDDSTVYLSRFDLRLGAPAVSIAGNVDGGIVVAVPPTDTDDEDDDEDGDGIDDSEEGSGTVYSFGNGPAMQIASDEDITIGALAASDGGYSLLVEGSVTGTANYSSTDAYGIVIGGKGGTVDLPGGIGVTGTVTATTQDSAATALLINEGVTVGSLYNSGTINATINSQGEGAAYGILDLSGTLTTIENTGYISAVGSSTDIVNAINLSAATDDVTITQYMNEDDIATREEVEADLDEGESDSTVYTSITGNIVTGSGNDTIAANAGWIVGNTTFNEGDDSLLLSGEAYYNGKVYFGDGAALAALSNEAYFTGTLDFAGLSGSLTLADDAIFFGTIANGEASSIVVDGGTFGADGVKTFTVGSLTIGAGGTLNAYIDGDTGTSSLILADTATFEAGATVSATVNSLVGAEGSYVILSASNIEGDPVFDEATTQLPYIFTGSISVDANDLILDIRRKTADEVGLTRAAASGYDAILTAAENDDVIAQSFLDIEDGETLQAQVSQMLPDHAGGPFDSVTRATRLVAQHVMDRDSQFDVTETGDMSVWLEPVMWRTNRDATGTNSYKTSGWGMSGGAEWLTDIGYVGGSYAWLGGEVENNGGSQTIDTSQHDLGLFWRTGRNGSFYGFARVGAARTSFSSERNVTGAADDSEFTYTTVGDWSGWLFSGMGGASYNFTPTRRLSIRPKAVLEWYRLSEGGYTESGGGEAIDLAVAKRNSSALSGITSLAVSYAFGPPRRDYHPLTLELEGGRRSVLSGKLGATTASFAVDDVAGTPFTITPDAIDDAWLGELRLFAGGWDYTWKIAGGVEKRQNSDLGYSGRISLSVAF
ncbi:autotransporter outer membrane beta-barrel domain-containing protein [Sphingopyxis chilensis]|uniref:autotransporter outer membrane beta-barrel domain-containing protein n=1 Tax=Sphingopyxis chilensis TaxID=180400 RepID=UPI002DDD003F|nr:autotransporter outer membrane beta-barrel domain-containing protein [Sphingopyxis chilensis]